MQGVGNHQILITIGFIWRRERSRISKAELFTLSFFKRREEMTPTFCAVCRYLLMSEDHTCPLCGWPISNTPVSFGVEQVRKIIENVHSWDYQQNKGYRELSDTVIKDIRSALAEKEREIVELKEALNELSVGRRY
jgi:hypothetical protein